MIEIRKLKKPQIKQVNPGILPEPSIVFLKNGIPVYITDSGTEDIERIEFSFDAGNIHENSPLLASTTNLMLIEGSEKYRSTLINRLLDTWSAFFHPYVERDRAGFVIYFLNRHLEKILDIAGEILFHSVFPDSELKLLMKKRYRKFLIEKDKVYRLAAEQFFESIFGNQHPYGRQTLPADFSNMDREFLKNFHGIYYRPEKMAIFVSGKIHKDILPLLNKYFGEIPVQPAIANEFPGFPSGQKKRVIYIEKKGALQSAIKIGAPTINKRHEDYFGLKALNVILGGYFGSRLMKNLREEKGYTYGVNSSVVSLNLCGFLSISSEVSNKFTRNAVDEIYKEIKRLQTEPVPVGELSVVRNYMLGELVRMFDGPFSAAESFRSAWEFGFDNSYYTRFAARIRSIEPDEIKALAKKYYKIDDLYEVTAG
jgi:Predicted Zn-dependent peptidases